MLFFFLLAFPVAVWAQSTDIEIEPVRTSITVREAVEAESSGYVTAVDAESLDSRPGVNIDDRLRDIPGFSLFRRSSSLVAHPTTQGVSLRGIGSSAAGRTLVLYDGFPVNDPFGLDQAFKNRRLPGDLDLAITGAHGLSISALIGLTAECEGVQLPLASWGAGTRRFAALAIAEENQGEAPITLVDEVERGLEPYRQRVLISTLQNGKSQTFVTTHSPSVLAAASESAVWYVDQAGSLGSFDAVKIDRHRRTDPEAFFARLTVIAEGVTERGFVIALLEKALGSSLSQHGVYVADAGGNESALNLLEALERGGLTFAGFADEEGKFPSRWREVQAHLGDLLFRWRAGCLEENIIGAVPNEKLESLLIDPDEDKTGRRLRTLADRLSMDQKEFEGLKAAAGSRLRDVILEAALGKVPADDTIDKKAYSKHGQTWFKSVKGGRELAQKLFDLDAWSTLRPELMTFCNAVRRALDLAQLEDLIHE